MRYEILGFNQEKVIEAELDLTDLMILNYIIQANGNPTLEHIVDGGIAYVWVSHIKFLADLPILPISEGTFKNRLCELRKKGLIISKTVTLSRGSKTYYSITALTASFINDLGRHSKMTSDISVLDILDNKQLVLLDNKPTSNNTSNNYNKEKEDTGAVEKFVADYNEICKSLPKCTKITDKRRKAIKNILKKYTEGEILEVFRNLESSNFCTGRNDRGWKADIDFLLREDKFVSILEGKYNTKRRNTVEAISDGDKKGISAEEREELRKAVERGELKEY